MTYFRDLERCTYFDRGDDRLDLVAVGWLDGRPSYSRGPIEPARVQRLFSLIADAFDPARFRGVHGCELCGRTIHVVHDSAGCSVEVGATNLFIPATAFSGLYAAPSLVLHYIIDHGYLPPPDFLAAVEACPPMTSSAYFRRIEAWFLQSRHRRNPLTTALGAALAGEAGLMSLAQHGALLERYDPDFQVRARSKVPAWFEARWLEPLRSLAEASREDALASEALARWIERVESLGRLAPDEQP